ncbi:MAG: lipoyl synthase, partial [Anaerolineae bacterium]|nr:lipoyl synthase [Phycisphaerae bacterium]
MTLSLNVLGSSAAPPLSALRKPSWLKMKMPAGEAYGDLLRLVNE